MHSLSQVIPAHKRDARCLDYYEGVLVSGGNDKKFHMFQYKNGKCTEILSSDIFDSEILCLKINRKVRNSSFYVIVGCRNGHIYAFDQAGNPTLELTHNSNISSVDFIDENHIVSGSWDGKAVVWSLTEQKKISQFSQHKYAVSVFYNSINGYVVSGSQDKALNLWDWKNGNKIKRVENAHNDIVREISDVEGSGMLITCSNDDKLKLWSADLDQIQTFYGHTSFVFTVKAVKLGKYISGGEDKTVKIWVQDKIYQDIQLPCTIWSVVYTETEDIITAGSDGYIRIFTTDETRKADPDVLEIFNRQILEASAKKSGMNEEDIKKLGTIEQMKAFKGKKQGEIRVFRNGLVPQAYMWQGGQWVKIGDVITEGGGSGPKAQPKHYPGDQYFEAGNYDHLFDVDDDSGVPKIIPFNDGGNPLEAAEKYIKRQGLNKGYLQQIRKFLIQNSSKIPRSALQNQETETMVKKFKCTPSSSIIEYNDIKNPPALFNKIKQFNEKAQAKKLNQKQISHVQRIVTQLENSQTYHTWKLDFKQIDTVKKLLTWPRQIKFPVWDLFRAFLKHYQSQSFFSGLQAGGDIITSLSITLEMENTEPIYALVLKTLSNALIQNTNKGGMIKNSGILFASLTQISKRENLKNASFLSAFAGLLYNFSIALIEKNIQKEEILIDFGLILRRRLELDEDPDNKNLLLQAGANILYKYHEVIKQKYKFLITFLSNHEVSDDIKQFY